MQLEDRAQPGTLLTTGVDASALAGAIEEPQQKTSERVISRLKTIGDVQIVSSPLAEIERLLRAQLQRRARPRRRLRASRFIRTFLTRRFTHRQKVRRRNSR